MNKKLKRSPEAHVANTKYGMGDYYGTGVKQKVGRLRESYMAEGPMTNKKLGKPPKSYA